MTTLEALREAVAMLLTIEKGGSYSNFEWFEKMREIRDALSRAMASEEQGN